MGRRDKEKEGRKDGLKKRRKERGGKMSGQLGDKGRKEESKSG